MIYGISFKPFGGFELLHSVFPNGVIIDIFLIVKEYVDNRFCRKLLPPVNMFFTRKHRTRSVAVQDFRGYLPNLGDIMWHCA